VIISFPVEVLKEPYLICPKCGFKKKLFGMGTFRCPLCGHPLSLEYEAYWRPRGWDMLRYSTMLPFTPHNTLGEGGTPLVAGNYHGVRVWFKLEYLNPTGSFKDRGTVLAVDHAFRLGYKTVVEDTSGNTGISVAAYSSLYGLESIIVMPKYAPRGKKITVRLLGGRVIEAEDRGEASTLAEKLSSKKTYHVAHTWNPLYIAGASTISFETYEQRGVPDMVIVPVGSGGLFLGIMRGFEKLAQLGLTGKVPRPIIVEGASVAPIYEAITGTKPSGESRLADGIMVPNPPRKDEIVEILQRHNGSLIIIDDNDIIAAWKKLFKMGYIVEPTSAAPLAALDKMLRENKVIRGARILIPLTGTGFKTLDLAEKLLGARGPRPH
jgi:threonine synthase